MLQQASKYLSMYVDPEWDEEKGNKTKSTSIQFN